MPINNDLIEWYNTVIVTHTRLYLIRFHVIPHLYFNPIANTIDNYSEHVVLNSN